MRPGTHAHSVLIGLTLATGCSYGTDAKLATEFGVTQGGTQDMQLARDIIIAGGIPTREQYAAEGLFSEHDLSIEGAPCDALLCPRVAMAQIQTIGTTDAVLLAQLGFATQLDPETFERDALDLVVAVDISSSMSGEKIGATRHALRTLVDQLDEGDRLGLVAFDDTVEVRSELTRVDEGGRDALLAQIDALETQGGTWIEGGLQAAFRLVDGTDVTSGVSKRVMIFTDAQPNVGDTRQDSFLALARDYADRDIGLTSFGVGLDLGAELTRELAKVRGGNSFTLSDRVAVETVFDENFDFMVTPIAYDLEVDAIPSTGLELGTSYGAPTDPDGEVRFGASTLFLSNNGGGMGITLTSFDDLAEGALEMSISYEPASGDAVVFDEVTATFAGGTEFALIEEDVVVHAADDAGVFTMAVLIDELSALDQGADFCEGATTDEAAALLIDQAARRLLDSAELVDAEALREEAELMQMLAENVRAGQDRCEGY